MARNDRSHKDPTGTEPGPANADLPPEDRASRPAPEAAVDDPMPAEPDAILPEARATSAASAEANAVSGAPQDGQSSPATSEPEASVSKTLEAPESALIPPPAPPQRSGPSPWIALPVGALAGALAAAAVAYGLNGRIIGGTDGDLTARIVVLESRPIVDPNALTTLSARVAKLEAVPPVDVKAALSGIQGDVNALKQSQQTLLGAAKDSAAAAASVSQQATALSARIDAVQKKMEEVAATSAALDKSVAALAVLGSLREAILSGRPYSAELDAARAVLGQGAAALEPAAASAATGLPTPAELSRRLAEAASAAGQPTAEASAASASGSMVDRLLSSAESLVKLRSSETAAPPAAVDRLSAAQAALRAGDLDKAVEALNALPPDLKSKLAAVTAQITARRDAANAAATLYQQALAAISGKVP